jgi:tetratricopeptide (TPR) repeat protein
MTALTLLATLGAALGTAVHAPVPQTPLYVTVAWPGFARDSAFERNAVAQYGADKVVLAGSLEGKATSISILTESTRGTRTSAQWREALGESKATAFQAGQIACSEQRLTLPNEAVANDFHGYVIAGGLCFDVHATAAAVKSEPELDRADFIRLVGAVTVSFPRRGTAADLPNDVRELMHNALAAWPRWSDWIENERRTRHDDVALEFTCGELAVLSAAKPDQIIAAHSVSLALFTKLRTPNTQQRFAWMLAEESLGLALFESGKPADSIEPLQKSFEIADQIKSRERAAIAYNLARACGAGAKAADAVKYLNEAIAGSSQYKSVASRDRAFSTLASDKRFQALVRP